MIGLSRASEEFRTSSHRIAQFARSFDDSNPRHLTGEIAPPVFSHVPVMQSMIEVLDHVATGFVLHGEHDFVFHRPVTPGQRLFTVSALMAMHGTRAGRTFVIRSVTSTHDGEPVTTQYSTCLVRGEASTSSEGERVPARPRAEKGDTSTASFALGPDQTRRYADASRDYSAYTIDPEVAAKAGYAAPLVHGMLSLCYAGRAIVDGLCGGDMLRLKRLGCRFAHPLLLMPGQTLTVTYRSGGFEAADSVGNPVIKNGYAEIAA